MSSTPGDALIYTLCNADEPAARRCTDDLMALAGLLPIDARGLVSRAWA